MQPFGPPAPLCWASRELPSSHSLEDLTTVCDSKATQEVATGCDLQVWQVWQVKMACPIPIGQDKPHQLSVYVEVHASKGIQQNTCINPHPHPAALAAHTSKVQ